jgi:hypothetical protein
MHLHVSVYVCLCVCVSECADRNPTSHLSPSSVQLSQAMSQDTSLEAGVPDVGQDLPTQVNIGGE